MEKEALALMSGDTIIFFYDLFVLCLFLFELFLYVNRKKLLLEFKENRKTGKPIPRFKRVLWKLVIYYDRHGVLTVNTILLIILLGTSLSSGAVGSGELLALACFTVSFMGIMYFTKRLFVGLDHFKDGLVGRCVDVVFYLILGHCFVSFSSFIEHPSLPLTLGGLLAALALCFLVMVRAIINPMVLVRPSRFKKKKKDALGILKGMGVLMVCVLTILYLMVFSCWSNNPGYYISTSGQPIDALDLIYYLFVAFSTIGFGDIVPVRADGLFYSRLVAITIAIASIFTTAFFVGSVVAGASNSAADDMDDASVQEAEEAEDSLEEDEANTEIKEETCQSRK